jgi:transcriptional regulator with XRE-family HTH domain
MPKVTSAADGSDETQTIVRKLRARGSQAVATEVGVNRSYLSHIFHGRRWPSMPVACRIAEALEVTVEELNRHLQRVRSEAKAGSVGTTADA